MKSCVFLLTVLLVAADILGRSPPQVVKDTEVKTKEKIADNNETASVDTRLSVLGIGKDVVAYGKDAYQGSIEAGKSAINYGKDVASSGAAKLQNGRDVVIDAGKAALNTAKEIVYPEDVCYIGLGCFSMKYPWYSALRALPAPDKPEDINVCFYLYTRKQPLRFTVAITKVVDFSLSGSTYDGDKETFFITHGFASNGNSSWLSDMKDAILKKYDGNVFLVDWGKGASQLNYFQVAANTRVVGATLAKFGHYLINNHRAKASKFHLIGHSLGAQISSYMAKNISGVARLTALDPAQPAFETYSKAVRLDQSDAAFVQVIHTSSRPFIPLFGLGMIQAYGHVDFYMNGGWTQPGCTLPQRPNITSFLELANVPVEILANFISCPHGRSYEFLTATLESGNCTFWGHRASVITKVASALTAGHLGKTSTSDEDCEEKTCSPLGFEAINYPGRGSFAVDTSSMAPFCVPEPKVDAKMKVFRKLIEK